MRIISIIFAVVALGFAFYGIQFMYDNSYSNRVVGGDAYNFIIYATRGTAYVGVGIVLAALSVTAAVLAGPQESNSMVTDQNATLDNT